MFEMIHCTDAHCRRINCTVSDKKLLASAIAHALIQEYSLARAFLTATPTSSNVALFTSAEIQDIINRRLHPVDVYHRDGFLFQLMMWLFAHTDLAQGDLVSLPHSQGSAKGQDCIIVHSPSAKVAHLTVCEDKATDNPRKTIRTEVWPEIEKYEKGERIDELRSAIISTLGTSGIPHNQAIDMIRGVSWEKRRRYRVRVTIKPTGRTNGLFKGFSDIVSGTSDRRRGEAVSLPAMRQWMDGLSNMVESELLTFIRQPLPHV